MKRDAALQAFVYYCSGQANTFELYVTVGRRVFFIDQTQHWSAICPGCDAQD